VKDIFSFGIVRSKANQICIGNNVIFKVETSAGLKKKSDNFTQLLDKHFSRIYITQVLKNIYF
jgi:hypothetical protein